MNSARAAQIAEEWLGEAPAGRTQHVAGVLRELLPYPVAWLVVDAADAERELLVLGADALYRVVATESDGSFGVTVRRVDFDALRPVEVTDVRGGEQRTRHWSFGPPDGRVRIVVDDAAPAAAVLARELARRVGWPDLPPR